MKADLKSFCQFFYISTAIPVSCYHIPSGSCTSFPAILSEQSIFKNTLHEFADLKKTPDYFISRSFSYFGCVRTDSGEYIITLGPVFSTPVSDHTVHTFMQEWAISPDSREEISRFLSLIPSFSFERFLYALAFVHLCLNQETIDIEEHFNLNDTGSIHKLSSLHTDQVIHAKESQHVHNTYQFERRMLHCVQEGKSDGLKDLLNSSSDLSAGVLADNSLRQEKNLFISLAALVTRSAIAGGMDMEQAYLLADVYIQECERSHDVGHISSLTYSMLIDFTERVSQAKIPQGMSPEIFECVQFISQHINEPIQVGDVAEHVGRSRSYLTSRFKKELGFDISSFIMRRRLEEAKSLLTYSDKSLSEISSYLCFSSQSYFQNVFKKKYGITPNQYRINTQKA